MKKIIALLLLSVLAFGYSDKEIASLYKNSFDYEKMAKYIEAIKVLTPLYKKYPKGYTLNLRFGWLFYLNGKYKDAQKHYQKATLIAPSSIEPKLGLTRIFLAQQSYEKAQQLSYEILKIDYYNYYGNIYAIQALNGQKKYKTALAIIQKMRTLYPTDIAFLELLGVVYKATNSKNLQQLKQDILTLDPNNIFAASL